MRLITVFISAAVLNGYVSASSFKIPKYKPISHTSEEYEEYLKSIEGIVEAHNTDTQKPGDPILPPVSGPTDSELERVANQIRDSDRHGKYFASIHKQLAARKKENEENTIVGGTV